jgi:hypothetical protein
MTTYRAYKLNPAGRITAAEWIEAADETEARAKAHAMCDAATPQVELWLRHKKLAVLPCKDGEAA